MVRKTDVLERMRRNPADVPFAVACAVAQRFFGAPRHDGTSHKLYRMPWAGDPRVNRQRRKDGKAKTVQVRQLLAAIERLQQGP